MDRTADYYPDFGGKAVKLTSIMRLRRGRGKFIEAVSGGWPEGLVEPQVAA
jgi:hypothetical protein